MRSTKLAAAFAVGVLVLTWTVGPVAAATDDPPSSYVLTFDEGTDPDAVLVELERSVSLVITHRFDHALKGAVVQTSEVPEEMAMVPGVATVERDLAIELPPVTEEPVVDPPLDPGTPEDPDDPGTPEDPDDPGTPEDPGDPETPEEPEEPEEPPVLWNLDRLDQRQQPLDETFDPPTNGAGVRVYVVDSGISPHFEFGARLAGGVDLVGDGLGTSDCNGHGTHVAGTIGGELVGVADEATLVPVRVFGCSGGTSLSRTISAFDWIVANHPAGAAGVVNFSAGGVTTEAEQAAVQRLIAVGITVVTAAGNDAIDACGVATGIGIEGAIVVGATDPADARSVYSNGGQCVDIFAPGDQIISASAFSPDGYTIKDGTSMATPHVSGAAAVLMALDPWRTPIDVEAALQSDATAGIVGGLDPSSPNLLLYVDPARTASPPNPTPVAPAPAPPSAPPAVAGTVQTAQAPVAAAALAFTGGDPRAMLVLALMMLCSGAAALTWSRRRERDLAAAVAAAQLRQQQRASAPLVLVRPRRR